MSSCANISDALSSHNLEFAPMRSLDEFMFGSARFQIPNVRDLDKWGNRVVKNLLYYQTNYFAMCLGIYGLLIILNPQKFFCGLIIQSIIIAVLLRFFVKRPHSKFKLTASWSNISQGNTNQKWYFLACVLICGYLFLHWSNAIFLTIFTVLLPVSRKYYSLYKRYLIKEYVVWMSTTPE
ncbi:PRA1 family protein 3-like [Ceratitis capitata]|uniref:PRA1 family protein 3-like n=1 Tax=Ceratitis capitata TaxID=7213 RepID=UPI000C6C4119|nr:PRA1 family protein 3-like [Ceratitis capitata]